MPETTQLLERWRAGDETALAQILDRHLPWLRERVRQLLGHELRSKVASDDIVQEAVVDFLRYGPHFVPQSEPQLLALLARIVANTVCDHGNWFAAARRRMSRETRLGTSVEIAESSSGHGPDARAGEAELEIRLRLAMELLSERDRQLLVWREWEKLSFGAIGARLGLEEEGARAASRRAVARLREKMARLRQGDIDGAIVPARD